MKIIDEAELNKQPYDDNDDYISRGHYKKESADIQKFGEQLAALSMKQIDALDFDEFFYDNLIKLKTIKPKTEAYRRHQQFIGKLMRDIDLDELQTKLNQVKNTLGNESVQVAKFEKLQKQLLEGGDSAIFELVSEHPSLDRQILRQMVRKANKELEKSSESKTARELFKYLRSEI
ncbi:ribosome-associated protein [Shewanella sp. 202IG2-18]|uniref:ribosome biogenesis factor YjgA n=1 Tax=Parashewanella hymeniacidonis TaxID=2807618 RepID=UPI001960A8E1|nr:ribosome biogenesis factor YjgA [Parashewanella hymeniacidonis]MBM7072361.1 ribosome-associated protein [Parashewanella hymeniacidonis]